MPLPELNRDRRMNRFGEAFLLAIPLPFNPQRAEVPVSPVKSGEPIE
jgi:hypothetical protein